MKARGHMMVQANGLEQIFGKNMSSVHQMSQNPMEKKQKKTVISDLKHRFYCKNTWYNHCVTHFWAKHGKTILGCQHIFTHLLLFLRVFKLRVKSAC
jgi:hypothetical protein